MADICLDGWPNEIARLCYHEEFPFICICHVFSILPSTSIKLFTLHDNLLTEVRLVPHFTEGQTEAQRCLPWVPQLAAGGAWRPPLICQVTA